MTTAKEGPIKLLNARLVALLKRVKEIDKAARADSALFRNTLSEYEKKTRDVLSEFGKRIGAYDVDFMLKCNDDFEFARNRHNLMFDKLTVVTEVAFYVRKDKTLTDKQRTDILMATIFCLDLKEDWWHEEKMYDLSVKGWAKRCLDAHREARLHQASAA